jgi:hypothetical protein
LAARRGQTKSEVIRDAIAQLGEGEGQGDKLTARDRLAPFIGIVDSGGQQLSTETGRRFREILEQRRHARRSR